MTFRTGKNFKVTLGSDTIVGMGTVTIPGVDTELLETTEFGDEWKTFTPGLRDGGEITFNGLYDPDDSSGQTALRTANENATDVTSLRIYIDNTSYWTFNTTGPYSYGNITKWEIGGDKSSLGTATFSLKVSGKLMLV